MQEPDPDGHSQPPQLLVQLSPPLHTADTGTHITANHKHRAQPELPLDRWDTCMHDLGSHRLWKHWPFSHFKGLLFMAFQLSLVRSRKSEVVSPGSVNRMWLPWVIILFLLKCRWLLTPGSQTPMATLIRTNPLLPKLALQRLQEATFTLHRTLSFQSIFTTKRTEELQNVLKI